MRRSLSPTDLAQKAFVRGFTEDVEEEAVRRLFSKYGTVTDVHIAKDRETQRPRGFGFVTFSSSTDCNKACEGLEGKEFHGRILQVELASHYKKPGSRGGFNGSSRGRGSFRGGRGGGSPPRDSYRRGGSSFRGAWRGGRDDFKSGYGSSRLSEERYRGSYERDLPPRDYGGRFEASFEYRGARPERGYLDGRGDYPSYRGSRDYPPGSDRDYLPPRSGRELGGYYSPPRSSRDYPPSGGRDYPPPTSRDYPMSRSDRDYDMPPRRYAARDYDDFPPPSSTDAYDIRAPSRRDFEPRGPPREFSGTTSRYESFSGNGRASYKSPRGASYRDSDYGGRGSLSAGRRQPPRDEERMVSAAGMRRPQRNMDGPPVKKMKSDESGRRSPRGGGGAPSRRY